MENKYDRCFKLLLINFIIINFLLFHFLKCYCQKCRKFLKKNCMYCPREIIFHGLNIASREETLNEIINNNKSIARFGDGEFKIIFGLGIGFHKSYKKLKIKLLNVLNSSLNNLLIGLNMPYHEQELNLRPDEWRIYWTNYINKYKFKIRDLLNVKRKYYFALVFKYSLLFKKKKKIRYY